MEERAVGCSWMGAKEGQLGGKGGEPRAAFVGESNERVRIRGRELETTPVRDQKSRDREALGGEEKHKGGQLFRPRKKLENPSPSGFPTWFSNTQEHLPVSE